MVVFGGRGGPTDALFNDAWRLLDANGDTSPQWQAVNVSGVSPAPRWLHQAVYDSDTDRMIVHGGGLGKSSPCSNETWVLTDASGVVGSSTWSLITSGGPAPRFDHSAVYDDANDRLIVFAGSNCFSAPSFGADVWVLSDADGIGTPVWTQLSPTGSITDRMRHTAAYDPTSNRMIVYGGANNSGTPVVFNDVHVLTEANGLGGTPQWIDITPTSGPAPPPDGPRSVYDVDDNRLVIFGGPLGNAVWILQNANGLGGPTQWVEITPTSGPAPDSSGSHSMVFDAANDRIIIFGGFLDESHINEVWTLDIDGTLGVWTTKAPAPFASNGPSVGAIDGLIYAVAGWNVNQLNNLAVYNPATDTWTTRAPRPDVGSDKSHGVINGVLYEAGGVNCCVVVNSVFAYDPATDTWSTKAPLPTKRMRAASGVIAGKLYVAGWHGRHRWYRGWWFIRSVLT